MLLIGDIHANARHINAILDNMKKFVEKFSDEKNVVFLGDYMYMFSYDRQALGDLFDFFLELRSKGKNVYILTGNHDWLNQHFVYHEGKKAVDMIVNSSQGAVNSGNKICFITEPETHTIEGKEVLFMPYNKGFLGSVISTLSETKEKQSIMDHHGRSTPSGGQATDSGFFGSALEGQAITTGEIIKSDTQSLLSSSNYNEQLSGALNTYLLENYKPGMTLIHHYYTADIAFPGQQAKFNYKDISLHPLRTKYADKVISGHLHKACTHENYLCVGSVRSTTSGERNQSKFLRKRDTTNDTYEAYEIAINPYVVIESGDALTVAILQDNITTIQKEHTALLPDIHIHSTTYSLEKTSLILYSNDSVNDIENIIDPTLKASIGDIQLKQRSAQYKDMTELLDISQYNIQQSLLDWKELVKKYLMSRYGPESEKYSTLLSELNIL